MWTADSQRLSNRIAIYTILATNALTAAIAIWFNWSVSTAFLIFTLEFTAGALIAMLKLVHFGIYTKRYVSIFFYLVLFLIPFAFFFLYALLMPLAFKPDAEAIHKSLTSLKLSLTPTSTPSQSRSLLDYSSPIFSALSKHTF